ncbi:hypothetical protein SARC_17776, partial [Sphaeroforma arctica JP610]
MVLQYEWVVNGTSRILNSAGTFLDLTGRTAAEGEMGLLGVRANIGCLSRDSFS